MDLSLLNRITSQPKILDGTPTIRGTRISVIHILQMLSRGINENEIIEEYPLLETDDIRACLVYAANVLNSKEQRKTGIMQKLEYAELKRLPSREEMNKR